MNEYEVREIAREEAEKKMPGPIGMLLMFIVFGIFCYGVSQTRKEFDEVKEDVKVLKEKVLDVQK